MPRGVGACMPGGGGVHALGVVGDVCLGACVAGGGACMAGQMATAAGGGTHPTGMHSCCK